MRPTYYRDCWHVVSRRLFTRYHPLFSLVKEVYTPKGFILHAASRGQAFAHCRRFPVAATRRCMARVSVPLWLDMLSHQLPVIALVGFYPTNKLIGVRLLSKRAVKPFTLRIGGTMQDYPVFRRDVLHFEVDTLPLLTRLPFTLKIRRFLRCIRLACLRHAVSVNPEPGSNSQKI